MRANTSMNTVSQGSTNQSTPADCTEGLPPVLDPAEASLGGNSGTIEGGLRGKPRGFATMTPEKIREIASKGGKAAHAAGTAHQFDSAEAREAGKKGGRAPHKSRGGRRKAAVLPDRSPRTGGYVP